MHFEYRKWAAISAVIVKNIVKQMLSVAPEMIENAQITSTNCMLYVA